MSVLHFGYLLLSWSSKKDCVSSTQLECFKFESEILEVESQILGVESYVCFTFQISAIESEC